MSKPFSQACENNKQPILDVISEYYSPGDTVLEIGSYTTQHVRFFAERLPSVNWLPSDTEDCMPLVLAGLEGNELGNILPPVVLEAGMDPWPVKACNGVFSANTLHIMPETEVDGFFRGTGATLKADGYLCVYGPFKYGGDYTSDSNARFDQWLKARDPLSGIRDFERAGKLAQLSGLEFIFDHAMPANNQLLVWRKK